MGLIDKVADARFDGAIAVHAFLDEPLGSGQKPLVQIDVLGDEHGQLQKLWRRRFQSAEAGKHHQSCEGKSCQVYILKPTTPRTVLRAERARVKGKGKGKPTIVVAISHRFFSDS